MSIWQVRLTRLSFGVAPAGNTFQRKTDEIFRGLQNVFGIADDILILGCDADSGEHDRTLRKVKKICCSENLNKINAISGAPNYHSSVRELLSREGVQLDPRKL